MDHGWWVPSSDWFVSSDRVVSLRARPSRTWGFSAECLCLFVHICSVGSNPLVGAGFVLLAGWNIPQEISLACSAFHGHPYPEQACYCVLLEGSFIKTCSTVPCTNVSGAHPSIVVVLLFLGIHDPCSFSASIILSTSKGLCTCVWNDLFLPNNYICNRLPVSFIQENKPSPWLLLCRLPNDSSGKLVARWLMVLEIKVATADFEYSLHVAILYFFWDDAFRRVFH